MDKTIAKIIKMLSDERIERQCAAAMVLGELRVKNSEAIDALGSTISMYTNDEAIVLVATTLKSRFNKK